MTETVTKCSGERRGDVCTGRYACQRYTAKASGVNQSWLFEPPFVPRQDARGNQWTECAMYLPAPGYAIQHYAVYELGKAE